MKNFFVVLLCCSILVIAASPRSAFAEKVPVNDDSASTDDSTSKARVPYKEAEDGISLRKMRRVGVGLQAAGALGLWGATLDLNFTPQVSVTAGYGGGQGFQSFEAQAKYVFGGTWIMPYMTFGYARWSSTANGAITTTNPPLLGDRLLSDGEKASGVFAKNILYPGIGLQYMQLDGDYAGTSVYLEATVLMDIGRLVAAPTGALGAAYYF